MFIRKNYTIQTSSIGSSSNFNNRKFIQNNSIRYAQQKAKNLFSNTGIKSIPFPKKNSLTRVNSLNKSKKINFTKKGILERERSRSGKKPEILDSDSSNKNMEFNYLNTEVNMQRNFGLNGL